MERLLCLLFWAFPSEGLSNLICRIRFRKRVLARSAARMRR